MSIYKVTTVGWWMAHYGSETAKRHWGCANTPVISKIDKGVLQGWKKKASTADPVRKYIDKKGVHRYAGTSSLRKTELLGVNPFYSIVEYNVMFVF